MSGESFAESLQVAACQMPPFLTLRLSSRGHALTIRRLLGGSFKVRLIDQKGREIGAQQVTRQALPSSIIAFTNSCQQDGDGHPAQAAS